MSPLAAVKSVLRKYATFSGRATRPEFWWWQLALAVVCAVLYPMGTPTADGQVFAIGGDLEVALNAPGTLYSIIVLATLIPNLAVGVRRLHDTGRAGWWILISIIPFGILVLLAFWAQRPTEWENAYGPGPVAASAPV